MISLGPLLIVAIILLPIAAIMQAWARRNVKRPLVQHAVKRRSPDDPPLGMEATDLRIVNEALRKNARLADQHSGAWPWFKPANKRPGT